VASIEPIFDQDGIEAENIALAAFEDIAWKCVVKKTEFSVGDLCVYIEVSSIVPDVPCFEFMRARGFKVKVARFLKTTFSNGLALPLSILEAFGDAGLIEEGMDVTAHMNVVPKPDPIIPNRNEIAGAFDTDIIAKTDEMRLQSVYRILDELQGKEAVATEKIDGTSITLLVSEEEGTLRPRVFGRNWELRQREDNVYWRTALGDGIFEAITDSGGMLVVQGELAGRGVSNGGSKVNREPHIYVFNLFDRAAKRYFNYDDLLAWCAQYRIYYPPTIRRWASFDGTVASLESLAQGPAFHDPKQQREGIVVRPTNRNTWSNVLGERISFKVINDLFALKND